MITTARQSPVKYFQHSGGMDKHAQIKPNVKRLFNYILSINSIMLELNMRYEGVRDLLMIVGYYEQYGQAINRYTLTQITSEFNTSTYHAGTKRINCMLAKHLIARSGHGKYTPTDKAIQLINSITI